MFAVNRRGTNGIARDVFAVREREPRTAASADQCEGTIRTGLEGQDGSIHPCFEHLFIELQCGMDFAEAEARRFAAVHSTTGEDPPLEINTVLGAGGGLAESRLGHGQRASLQESFKILNEPVADRHEIEFPVLPFHFQ